MKRIITLLTLSVLTFCFCSLFSGCDLETISEPLSTMIQNDENHTENKETVAKPAEPESNLGDYNVEIVSSRLAKDFQGNDIIIVKYKFTNVKNDDPISFGVAIEDNAYQDGVGLNQCYFADDSAEYNSDNSLKEIKKGASIEVEVAYELNDSSTDVEIEVKELFSLVDETVITKTFTLN